MRIERRSVDDELDSFVDGAGELLEVVVLNERIDNIAIGLAGVSPNDYGRFNVEDPTAAIDSKAAVLKSVSDCTSRIC